MRIPIRQSGAVGIVTDLPAHELQPNAWSQGKNVKFRQGRVEKAKGYATLFGTPSVAPYWLLSAQTPTNTYWLYAGLLKAYVTDMIGGHFNITRQQTTTISTIATGNPTSITTSAAHNIASGDTVVIAGVTGNTPDINASHVATVTGSTTFTIPVNTTVAGTGGSVTADRNYAATADFIWNGGILGKIPVINNGVDTPQMWNPIATGTRLADLSNWPASTKATVIRPFKTFLVALDITESSTRFPQMVRWSHPADPGAVPVSWDYTDTTRDAGRIELSETGDYLIDCLSMRDVNIVYKEKTAWAMQFIGGEFVFKFVQILREGGAGILTRNCVASLPGYQHFVVTFNDVIVHDGTRMESVIDSKMRTSLFNAIDGTNVERVFVAAHYARDEMLVCIPQSGDSFSTLAFIWNYKQGQWTKYELPGISYATAGVVDTGSSGVIDNDTGVIDNDLSIIDEREYNPTISKLVMAQPASTLIREYGTTEQQAGTNMTAYVERTGLSSEDYPPLSNTGVSKTVSEIWPRIRSSGSVNIYVGGQETPDGSVTWEGPRSFNPATDRKADFRTSGKLIGVRFESTTDVSWELDDYDIDFVEDGER